MHHAEQPGLHVKGSLHVEHGRNRNAMTKQAATFREKKTWARAKKVARTKISRSFTLIRRRVFELIFFYMKERDFSRAYQSTSAAVLTNGCCR
jgi:hypothetical protein